ncbi:MAG TPA: DUF4230 domain-containing protein [Rectinemataceae bacterium]|nr:DUF4230 domain-containing protein [Rectinemataceae bacterium]
MLVLCAVMIVVGFVAAGLPHLSLMRKDVSQRFVLYLEGIQPAGKLVVLTATERYVASKEFTATILALLSINAKVELSALADTSYFVDLQDMKRWSATWERRTGRLRIVAPRPDVLLPAVHTDTIEVHTEGQNLLTNAVFKLKREAEAMKSQLSADLEQRARAGLDDPELMGKIEASIADLARSFCSSVLGIEPRTVSVEFPER